MPQVLVVRPHRDADAFAEKGRLQKGAALEDAAFSDAELFIQRARLIASPKARSTSPSRNAAMSAAGPEALHCERAKKVAR